MSIWNCKCLKCGIIKPVREETLLSGRSKMCRKCSAKIYNHKKYTGDSIKTVFSGMYQRCYDKNSVGYHNYGGRGIKICDEWLNNREIFYEWTYKNGYSKEMSIERIDVNCNYCPTNCTFIPKEDQSKNRRNTYKITINEDTKCLSDWCRLYKADRHTVKKLHDNGMSWKDALELKKNTSKVSKT